MSYKITNLSTGREYNVGGFAESLEMVFRSEMSWLSDGVKVRVTNHTTNESAVFWKENSKVYQEVR